MTSNMMSTSQTTSSGMSRTDLKENTRKAKSKLSRPRPKNGENGPDLDRKFWWDEVVFRQSSVPSFVRQGVLQKACCLSSVWWNKS